MAVQGLRKDSVRTQTIWAVTVNASDGFMPSVWDWTIKSTLYFLKGNIGSVIDLTANLSEENKYNDNSFYESILFLFNFALILFICTLLTKVTLVASNVSKYSLSCNRLLNSEFQLGAALRTRVTGICRNKSQIRDG
jgi:hypothetical protein